MVFWIKNDLLEGNSWLFDIYVATLSVNIACCFILTWVKLL